MSSATSSEEVVSSDNGPQIKKLKTDHESEKVEDTGSLKNNTSSSSNNNTSNNSNLKEANSSSSISGGEHTNVDGDSNAVVDVISSAGGGGGGSSSVDDSGKEREYDPETQKALEEIDACQNEIDTLNEKASEEILKVEQKFNKLRKPFFEKRNDLIRKIPNFWVTAFVNHPTLTTILEEEEEECLNYLSKLEVEEFEDIKSGYKIIFHFEANPYFENEALIKEFHSGSSGDPSSTSTPIDWKNTELAVRLKEQTMSRSSGSNLKKRKRIGGRQTFFTWYLQNGDASADDIAEVIKDDMWPNPLQYFLVPDMEVENGEDREHGEDDSELGEGDESIVVLEDGDEGEEAEEEGDEEGSDDEEYDEEVSGEDFDEEDLVDEDDVDEE